MDSTRFLTLTIVSSDRPLREQLQDLRDSFARLRRHRLWRGRVVGGIYCVEVTWSVERRQWHPHLHAIIDGSYVPKSSLVDAWREASNGSYILDIAFVHSASRIASYVAKYVSKSDDASGVPDYMLGEWSLAVHGLRLVHAFGNLHGVKLVEKPEYSRGVSIEVINPDVLASAHHTGDVVAGRILQELDAMSVGASNQSPREILDRIELWERFKEAERLRIAAANPPPDPEPPYQPTWF